MINQKELSMLEVRRLQGRRKSTTFETIPEYFVRKDKEKKERKIKILASIKEKSKRNQNKEKV